MTSPTQKDIEEVENRVLKSLWEYFLGCYVVEKAPLQKAFHEIITPLLHSSTQSAVRKAEERDLKFLKEMYVLSQKLMKGNSDYVTAQNLNKMIEDWIDELVKNHSKQE